MVGQGFFLSFTMDLIYMFLDTIFLLQLCLQNPVAMSNLLKMSGLLPGHAAAWGVQEAGWRENNSLTPENGVSPTPPNGKLIFFFNFLLTPKLLLGGWVSWLILTLNRREDFFILNSLSTTQIVQMREAKHLCGEMDFAWYLSSIVPPFGSLSPMYLGSGFWAF